MTWNKPNVGSTAVIEQYELRSAYVSNGATQYLSNSFDPPVDANSVQLSQIAKTIEVAEYASYRIAVRVKTDIGGWSTWTSERVITLNAPPD